MQERPEPIGPERGDSSWMVWIVLASLLAVGLVFMFRSGGTSNQVNHPAIGQPLTYLTLDPLTEKPPKITLADLQGKVTLINYWGTWCPPCRQELPHLIELQEKYADEAGFQLLSVSCSGQWDAKYANSMSWSEDVESLRFETDRFMKYHEYDLPTYVDTQGRNLAALHKLQIFNGYPTSLMIDTQGIIRAVWNGYSSGVEQEMESMLRTLLSESP